MRLADSRLLRFVGINTPEIDHEKGKSEPLAEAARDLLVRLIGPRKQINIQYVKNLLPIKNLILFFVPLIFVANLLKTF